MMKMEIIYNAIIHSQADIETIRWILGKQIKKGGEIRVIVEVMEEKNESKEES